MNRSAADDWSFVRSLAFLAAIFAVVLGALLPAAAVAASPDGQPLVLCSAEGPQVAHIRADLDGGGERHDGGPKCAACITPLAGALPTPPQPVALPVPALRPENTTAVAAAAPPPPVRGPPRPPSTAPPLS